MKKSKISLIIFMIIGVIMGYASFLIASNLLSLILVIAVLFLLTIILRKVFKIEKKFLWFLSNGGWIYVFIWFITWIIFYNL